MPIEVICRVVPGGLMAANAAEASKLEDMKGQEVQARIYKPRNLRFHKLFFALLNTSLDMADVRMNPKQWRHHVTVGAGHCDFFKHGDQMIAVPKSISFADMDDAEFQQLYKHVLDFICETYVVDRRQLDQIAHFM